MRKIGLLLLLLIPLNLFSTPIIFNYDDYEHRKIELRDNDENRRIIDELGDVYVAYNKNPQSFISSIGEEKYILEDVYIYAKKENQIAVLGRIVNGTIYDSEGEILKSIPKEWDVASKIVGVSSTIFYSIGIKFIKEEDGRYYQLDTFMLYKIDLLKKTIYEFAPMMK